MMRGNREAMLRVIRFLPALAALQLSVGCHSWPEPGASLLPYGAPVGEAAERSDQPDAAERFARTKRLYGAGAIDPRRLYADARRATETMPRLSIVSSDRAVSAKAQLSGWSSLGPGNVGGRTRCLVIDPVDHAVMYAAGVSGGVWKTTNAGDSWTPVGDDLANIAVNSLVMDPGDHRVLYAGTGEGYFREEVRGTGLPLRGGGIFVTADSGSTWSMLPGTETEDFYWVNDMVASASTGLLYAATRSGVWRREIDGSWIRLLDPDVKGGCLDLAARTDVGGDYLFASCGTYDQSTVYRQPHAETEDRWEAVLSDQGAGRTSLAIAPSNQSIIYAMASSNLPSEGGRDQALFAFYRSDASGDPGSWQARIRSTDTGRLGRYLLTNPIVALMDQCELGATTSFVNMGWYVNVIAVDPLDPDRVWAAGVDLFRSDDGGWTWGVASYWTADPATAPSFAHADQHLMVFHPDYDGGANQTLFACNDGGVFRTDNARAPVGLGLAAVCNPANSQVSWTSLNHGYGVTQFYHGVVFPDGTRYLGGTQDNGTLLGDDRAGSDGWSHILGGDGGYSAIDATHPSTLYASTQVGAVYRSDDGGVNFRPVFPGADDYLFIAPLTMDPNNSRRLWIGGRRMWRSGDAGDHWTAASQQLAEGQVSAIAIAPGMSGRVVAGTSTGTILHNEVATTAGPNAAWALTRPRAGFVSSIAFDPTDAGVVYATYAGFGGTHVWKSTDAARTWSAIDGSGAGTLPDIPVHSLIVDPSRPTRLFLGTDLGLFVSADGGASWAVENDGLPRVVTEALALLQTVEGTDLYAFTHGRGVWRARVGSGAPEGRRRAIRR